MRPSAAMRTSGGARRCAWRARAGERCQERAETLDEVWERWLCARHAEAMAARSWTAYDSSEIATSLEPAA